MTHPTPRTFFLLLSLCSCVSAVPSAAHGPVLGLEAGLPLPGPCCEAGLFVVLCMADVWECVQWCHSGSRRPLLMWWHILCRVAVGQGSVCTACCFCFKAEALTAVVGSGGGQMKANGRDGCTVKMKLWLDPWFSPVIWISVNQTLDNQSYTVCYECISEDQADSFNVYSYTVIPW